MATTIRHFSEWKNRHEIFTVLTAYDYSMARWLAQAEVPVLLVGDSLGQVMLGYSNTLAVTLEDMIHHGAAVVRGAPESFVIIDMPFGSYQVNPECAAKNAIRIMQATGAKAIKLEGGKDMVPAIRAIVQADIPVMAHLGLTPQSIHQLGGYQTQAQEPTSQNRLMKDALAVQAAGAFAVVLEKIPTPLAKRISSRLVIPTIGCGSGPFCDGQVLVTADVVGLFPDFKPSFVTPYAHLGKRLSTAVRAFMQDVQQRKFPGESKSPAKRVRGK
jgi:3-methyl-2-oxobutanoate hydroxymethyltransferase